MRVPSRTGRFVPGMSLLCDRYGSQGALCDRYGTREGSSPERIGPYVSLDADVHLVAHPRDVTRQHP